MLSSGLVHSRACNELLPNSMSETPKSISALGDTSRVGLCSSAGPSAYGERDVTIRMAKIVSGRLRMDNKLLRYRFGYEGSVSACAALRAASD